MDKNNQQFSAQQLQQLASSPAAKHLLAMLQQEHKDAMNKAVSSAQEGDLEAARQALGAFLSDPKAKSLLEKLREEQHG